jgi:phosphocarrier protein HPr
METRYIKLMDVNDVTEFVNAALKCDFDIDISYNRFIIDAKSLVGVLSLDLTKILKVEYRGYDKNFEEVIKQYEA